MAPHFRTADGLRSSLWIAVAIGASADLYLPLAQAGLCVTSPAGLLWPAIAALGLTVIIARALRPTERWDPASVSLLGFAAIWLIAAMILDLVPPIARDELTHHLAIPALYAHAGRIFEIPFADQAYYPMLLEMFYTPLVANGWEIAAKYLHLIFGLASCALLFTYLRERGQLASAAFVTVLVFTTPTVIVLAASAYVDLGLLFYSVVALVALLRWSETQRLSDFVVSALGAGCAASVKYNGLLLIMLLGLLVLLMARKRGATNAIGLAIAFGLLSLAPLLPWLLKNFAETGNPIFPLFNGPLGGRPLPTTSSMDVFTKRQVLYGENWLTIVLTPLRVFITGWEGDPARFDGVFNPLYLLGFVFPFLRRSASRDRWLAALAALLLLMVFLLNTFRSRYAVPVLVPLALVVADALQFGLQRWRRGTLTLVVAALLFNAWHFTTFWISVDPLAYLSGRQSRREFISRFVPEYPLVEFANANLPTTARIDLEFLGSRGYYWGRAYTYDTYFSGATLQDTIRRATGGDEVAKRLRTNGISHIAAADGLLLRYLRDNLTEIEYKRWEDFARDHLRLLYDHQGFGLYEIV